MKRYDFDWGHVGIEQRESEDGEWVRYVDALAHYSKELDHAYAEGRTDESKEMAGPLMLMRDAFDLLESHLGDSEVEYEDDDEEREYAPVQVAARLLMGAIQAMSGPSNPTLREETVYEKSARWTWPDGRPDL
jgi:heme oxygenase